MAVFEQAFLPPFRDGKIVEGKVKNMPESFAVSENILTFAPYCPRHAVVRG